MAASHGRTARQASAMIVRIPSPASAERCLHFFLQGKHDIRQEDERIDGALSMKRQPDDEDAESVLRRQSGSGDHSGERSGDRNSAYSEESARTSTADCEYPHSSVVTVPSNARRIAILGYSGSGKSTLARRIASERSCPVLHLDMVHWLPGWQERGNQDASRKVEDFMDSHSTWVIEGNYRNIAFERRMRESDCIIILNVNRITCLRRVLRRRLHYRHTNRPDMTLGCNDKIDLEFLAWLLWKGRSGRRAKLYRSLAHTYPDRCIVVPGRMQIQAPGIL